MTIFYIILLSLSSYLIGSIPFGFIVAKAKGIDIRKAGSKSTGATNTMRVLGLKWGIYVFILDALKGMVIIALSYFLKNPDLYTAHIGSFSFNIYGLYGIMAVIGHIWPIFLNFKGGKAVATSFGVSLILLPFAASLGILVFFIIAVTTKYVSIGSMIGASTTLVTSFIMYLLEVPKKPPVHLSYIITFLILVGIIILRHRSNIKRLHDGTENKLDLKK